MSRPIKPLIVRLRNWVGDVTLGVPALKLLEDHGYTLELVGKAWAHSLLAGTSWRVHVRPSSLRERVCQLASLRQQCAQLDPSFKQRNHAIVFPTSFSAALEMKLAGLRAVGYRQEARGLLLARSEPIVYGNHALESYWELACRFLGVSLSPPASIQLAISPEGQTLADALIKEHHLDPGFVVICPFAGGTFEKLDKTWPDFHRFTAALLPCLYACGKKIVACPGPGEEHIILNQHPGVCMLPGLTLETYKALLKRSDLVVSNDTGPAHMAAAVGASVLSVLGPTQPEQWAPWGPQVKYLRQWPQWPRVEDVLEETMKQLHLSAYPALGGPLEASRAAP